MAQPIKYNTGTKTTGCCIRKGNYDIGIVQNREYGPTANTGFWAGYNVPSGGFVSFQNKASEGPSIYSIPDEESLVDYGAQLNLGGSYPSRWDVLQRCSELNTIALVNIEYPEIPLIDNCLLILDPGYTASYPWTGNTFFNVAGGNPTGGTLNGGVQFVQGDVLKNWANATLGYYTDKWVNVLPFGSALTTFTINVWVNIGSGNTGNINLVSQTYSQDAIYTPEADCNFFIKGDGTGNGFNGGVRVSGNDFVMNSGGFTSGNWNNLTLTYDGGNLIMYVNGSPIIPFVVVPTPTSNGLDTLIGGSINGLSGGASTDYFNGRIGVVHIYDTALDSGQVTEIYNTYRTRF
jgi:hypothetical protein